MEKLNKNNFGNSGDSIKYDFINLINKINKIVEVLDGVNKPSHENCKIGKGIVCPECKKTMLNSWKKPADQTIKADAGKIQYGLIPPECIKELAKVYMFGLTKYGQKDSWKQVDPARYKESLLRHVYEYLEGKSINEEDGGVRILAQIAWNAFTLLWMELNKR